MYFVCTNAIGGLYTNQLVGPFRTAQAAKDWAEARPSLCPKDLSGKLPVHDVCPIDVASKW